MQSPMNSCGVQLRPKETLWICSQAPHRFQGARRVELQQAYVAASRALGDSSFEVLHADEGRKFLGALMRNSLALAEATLGIIEWKEEGNYQ